MNLKPVNGHILIEPLEQKSFFGNGKFEEVGVVIAKPNNKSPYNQIKKGDRVFFDAWLAGKFPKPDGGEDDFYWLVRWSDIKAILPKDDAIPNEIPK